MNNKKAKDKYANLLMYAAAALSVVSFLTTFNGMKGIVTTNTAVAVLVSFGIQSIILFVGVYSIPTISEIIKQEVAWFLKTAAVIMIIVSYLSAMAFSSSFSYVYLANSAYTDVNPIDYDRQIDEFLVKNTKEIKHINEAEIAIVLKRIRETAPKFRLLKDEYNIAADTELKNILTQLNHYDESKIPDSKKFIAQEAINAFNGSKTVTADKSLEDDCKRIEKDVNQYIDDYKHYYQNYDSFYTEIKSISAYIPSDVVNKKKQITQCLNDLSQKITKIRKTQQSSLAPIQLYTAQKCSSIADNYDALYAEISKIKSTYESIETNKIIIDNGTVDLDNFYQAIYSTDILSTDIFNDATNDLKGIISDYIVSDSDIDENLIRELTGCVEFLNTLEQCKTASEKIQSFEDNNLSRSYIIGEIDGNDNGNVQFVDADKWNQIRRQDISEFISIIKAVPDASYITANLEGWDSNSNVIYLKNNIADDYILATLETAYDYNRNKLAKITEVERAWNYLSSKESGPAVFCLLIALFLDIASFIIGFVLYVSGKRVEQTLPEEQQN